MKKTSAKRRRKSIALILSAVMLVSIFGDCSAVFALGNGVAATEDEVQQTEPAEPADLTEPADADNDAVIDAQAKGVTQNDAYYEEDAAGVGQPEEDGTFEAQAEGTIDVTAKSSGRTVTVSWKTPESGDLLYTLKYEYVDYQDPNNLENPVTTTKEVYTVDNPTTETSYKKKLDYYNTYKFTVTAYRAGGSTGSDGIIATGTKKITPKLGKPPKAKNFKATSGYKKVTVQWKGIKKPSDDKNTVIWYRFYVNGKLTKKIQDKKGNQKTYKLTFKCKEGKEMKFAVRTVWRKNTPGHLFAWQDKDTKKPVKGKYKLSLGKKQNVKRGAIRPIKYNFTVTGSGTYYTSYKGNGVGGHLKSGTRYSATGAINTRYIISVNGRTRWMPTRYSKNRSSEYKNGSKKYDGHEGYYSKEEAENYVNARKLGSRTSYLIWVSAYAQRTYLFKKSGGKWKCKNSYLCSTGGLSSPTPTGKLRIWSRLMYRHGLRYWNNFYSLTALHQSPAKTMGYPSSRGGCVRLRNNVARYIYYNVPMNTAVLVY